MNRNMKKSLLVIAIGSLFAASAAQATNGYFSDGTGAKSRGMGGAGVALPQEAGSIATNPAAAVHLGNSLDVGLGLFSPKPRSYKITGNDCSGLAAPGCTLDNSNKSGSNYFPIPFYGQSFELDNKSSVAVTITALGGMNTNFSVNPFDPFHPAGGSFGNLGVDLKQVNISGVYARKINQKFSVGVSAGVIYQTFLARGLGGFGALSTDATKLSNNGTDTSTGLAVSIGMIYEATKDVSLGFAYTPETNMSKFKRYSGLFAGGGDFNIPSHYTLGLAWKAAPKVEVAVDYRRINYTDVAAISNDAQRLTGGACNPLGTGAVEAECLGGANGAGFGWSDMNIIKFGVAYAQSTDLTLRAGWNHGDSPVKSADATINIIAPAVVEDHLTLGMTKKLDSTSDITVDYIHIFKNSVSGDVPGIPGATAATGGVFGGGTTTISMEQNFIEVQYGKRF